MIALAAGLTVRGGRESIVRMALTTLGVALGTTLLLLLAAADPAIRTHQTHAAWQSTGNSPSELQGDGDPLLWDLSNDAVDGREMVVLRVAAAGPDAPIPLGLDSVPAPGEVLVSPALRALLDELPADRLADRFPAEPVGTIDDHYLVGPDELVAVVGAPATELEASDALEVHHVRTTPAVLDFSDFLRLVLGVGAIGLLVPVGVFVSTSSRLGAARREQRYAALRLAGATPRQVNLAAAFEAAIAACIGAVIGVVGYQLLRPVAAGIEIDGQRSFVSSVGVPLPVLLLALLAIPTAAAIGAVLGVRRLQISPLGVARRSERARPTARRLIPVVLGSVGFVGSLFLAIGSGRSASIIPVMAMFALMIVGIVVAGPWLTLVTAQVIHRLGRRSASLLASRRLQDDPGSGFRAVSGLVVAVFVASTFAGVIPALNADAGARLDGIVAPGTLIAELPGGTTGSEADAALIASGRDGVAGGVVLRRDPDPERPLADPARGRGPTYLAACDDLPALGVAAEGCAPGGTAWIEVDRERLDSEPAPYPSSALTAMPPELLVVSTDGTAPVTDAARTAIQQTVPGTTTWLGAEQTDQSNRRLGQIERLTQIALAIVLVVAGCSLAVAVAGGIIERARPFGLLRLSGVRIGELRQVAMLEAAAPLLLMASASAALGLSASAAMVALTGNISWTPPTAGYWISLAGGLAAALAIAAATLPLLDRATSPDAVRFE